jgi:streptomycin 6-kinase
MVQRSADPASARPSAGLEWLRLVQFLTTGLGIQADAEGIVMGDATRFEWLGELDPREFAAAGHREGRAWVADLPALFDAVCQRWDLVAEEGATQTGYRAVVLPVRRGGESYVLKLAWPADRTVAETRALATWNGQGAVQLFEADTAVGVLLLERLDSRRTLHDLALTEAAVVAGRLLQRLAVPAPSGFRSLHRVASDIAHSLNARQERLGYPVPKAWLETAHALAEQFTHRADTRFLVHADLHYGNVLTGEREPWLAIDPKPIAGEPEHAVAELLWARADEADGADGVRSLLALLVDSGALDADRARRWAIVRCVNYWLWGVEHGLTEDPRRCQRVLAALT